MTSPWRRDVVAGVTAGVASAALVAAALWFALAPFDAGEVGCGPPVAGADPQAVVEGDDPCDGPGGRRLAAGGGLLVAAVVPLAAVARLRTPEPGDRPPPAVLGDPGRPPEPG